jgi:hypothetical protein
VPALRAGLTRLRLRYRFYVFSTSTELPISELTKPSENPQRFAGDYRHATEVEVEGAKAEPSDFACRVGTAPVSSILPCQKLLPEAVHAPSTARFRIAVRYANPAKEPFFDIDFGVGSSFAYAPRVLV